MSKEVNFEIAKLLKGKGFSWECSHFYSKSKYDKEFYLKTGTEYDSDRDCIWDWNLNGGKSGMLLKSIPYPNDDTAIYYSAPTIAEVVMWLYEEHEMWIDVSLNQFSKPKDLQWMYSIVFTEDCTYSHSSKSYISPTEAYKAAITYCLENLIQGGTK